MIIHETSRIKKVSGFSKRVFELDKKNTTACIIKEDWLTFDSSRHDMMNSAGNCYPLLCVAFKGYISLFN